jgi:hypothetical protein
MSKNDFRADFRAAIERVEADAKAIGVPMRDVCEAVGASRTTPSRWKRNTPATVELLGQMQEEVARRRAERRVKR